MALSFTPSHRIHLPGQTNGLDYRSDNEIGSFQMKVLELSELYPPDIGGTQRHVARQAEELTRRGHEVTVVTHAVGESPSHEVTPDGITVFRTEDRWLSRLPGLYQNPRQQYSAPSPEPKDLRLIRQLIRDNRPDVVLAHNWIVYSYLTIKRRDDPPVIWILHDYGAVCHKRSVIYNPSFSGVAGPCPGARLDRCIPCGRQQYGWAKSAIFATSLQLSRHLLNSKVDQIVAISSAVSDVSQIAFDRPIRIIPTFLADGLREVAFNQPLPDFCPAGDYLLYVGSLHSHKGVDILLDAYRRLQSRIPLVIIGTTSPGANLQLGDDVIVAFDVDHDQVMAAWAHCTLGVVPSVWEEPWGQVAAEAATVGKAVVATRVGGLQNVVVDGETGILVPPRDSGALREAIDLLVQSPETRAQMGQKAAAHVRPFTVSVVTDQIEQVIREVVPSWRSRD
jgi:glycosyltransferase involved in cell wall biosynthesis